MVRRRGGLVKPNVPVWQKRRRRPSELQVMVQVLPLRKVHQSARLPARARLARLVRLQVKPRVVNPWVLRHHHSSSYHTQGGDRLRRSRLRRLRLLCPLHDYIPLHWQRQGQMRPHRRQAVPTNASLSGAPPRREKHHALGSKWPRVPWAAGLPQRTAGCKGLIPELTSVK